MACNLLGTSFESNLVARLYKSLAYEINFKRRLCSRRGFIIVRPKFVDSFRTKCKKLGLLNQSLS